MAEALRAPQPVGSTQISTLALMPDPPARAAPVGYI
jgi:hypothetical protein